jgi:hypothetical protein
MGNSADSGDKASPADSNTRPGGKQRVIADAIALLGQAASYPSPEEMQDRVLKSLCELSESVENSTPNQDFAVSQNGIVVVFSIMAAYPTVDVLIQALNTFYKLAHNHPNNQASICDARGLTAILSTMAEFRAVPTVQEYSCKLLCTLAFLECNREAIAQQNGVQLVLAAMHAHPADSAVQTHACSVLSNLAVSCPPNKTLIASLKGGTEMPPVCLVYFVAFVEFILYFFL